VKATAATTAGALTVMESVVRQGPPRHVHTHEDECFYVLEGMVTGTCGSEAFEAGPRSFVFLPRGLAHAFRAADGEARVLLIAVPGGIEHYFGEINNALSVTGQESIGARYGIQVVLAIPAATDAQRTTKDYNYSLTYPVTRRLGLSADGQPSEHLIEAAGTRLVDEDLQLIHAHLHPLAEIIGDYDPPLWRGLLIDKQLRAAAIPWHYGHRIRK
jgi:mannose-6-phosphate isomerase-like protein (cupin superfamily)